MLSVPHGDSSNSILAVEGSPHCCPPAYAVLTLPQRCPPTLPFSHREIEGCTWPRAQSAVFFYSLKV